MSEEIFKVINFIALFQILVFIFILFRQKKIHFTSKFFLIVFIFSLGICLADRIQFFYRDILFQHNFPHFYNIGDIFLLVYIPALYFYYKSFTTAGFKLKWKYILHLTPAFLVFLNLLFNYYLHPADVKFSRLHDGKPFYTEDYQLFIINAFHVVQTSYFIVMLYLVWNYHKQIKELYSNINGSQIILLYLIPTVGFLIRILEYSFAILHTEIQMHIDLILVVYAALIVYMGYRQPKILLQAGDIGQKSSVKLSHHAVKENLIQLMKTEKYYLDPKISLTDLALKLGVNSRELSTLLNTQLKISFFNFINSYRIEEAKKMLSENNNTVLEILYEAGFNNKSAFNRVFKEKTGLTPTEYRKQKNQ